MKVIAVEIKIEDDDTIWIWNSENLEYKLITEETYEELCKIGGWNYDKKNRAEL